MSATWDGNTFVTWPITVPGVAATVAPGVELHTKLAQDGEADAVLPITWEPTPALIGQIEARDVKDTQLLLLDWDGSRETRWLVPIAQKQAFVQFTRPGVHHLFAIPVVGVDLRKYLLRTYSPHQYATPVLDFDHQPWPELASAHRLLGHTELTINVPDRFFAKHPPKLVTTYANLLFSHPPIDQCDLRKRLLFTSAVSLLAAAIITALTEVAIAVVPTLAPKLARWFGQHGLDILSTVGILAVAAVLTLAAIVGLHFLSKSIASDEDWYFSPNSRNQRRRTRQTQARLRYLAQLHGGKPKQTLYLRFRAIKAKVCRPYAR